MEFTKKELGLDQGMIWSKQCITVMPSCYGYCCYPMVICVIIYLMSGVTQYYSHATTHFLKTEFRTGFSCSLILSF